MADNIESTSDQEMISSDEPVATEEKPSTDIEELKQAVAEESERNATAEENPKATADQDEEEEYVLKDEAHEEEDNQKDEKEVNGHKDEKSDSMGDAVAKHYNSLPESGKEVRKQSRIFYLRNFNNWVKSVLINEYLEKARKARRRYDEEITILDLGCGKGGDLLKWQKARVGHVICADIAETSVEQCKERFENLKKGQRGGYRDRNERLFSLECIAADCTKVNLADKFKNDDMQLDLTSCQFAFHYSFESYKQAETMIRNACEKLRPGGYFIGTTPDAYELVKRVKKSENNSFGNELYNIDFEQTENLDVFGTKYHFKLHEVVDCPEFLVYFPIVEKLAEKYNMRLVYRKSFHDLFEERNKDYGNLIHKMQALEGYPARKGWSLVTDNEDAYAHVKEHHTDSKSGRDNVVGTLTKDEWEVAGLYIAFAFEKIDPEEEARKEAALKEAAQKEAAQKEAAQKEKSLKRAASPEKPAEEEESAPPSKKTRESEADDEKETEKEEPVTEEALKPEGDAETQEAVDAATEEVNDNKAEVEKMEEGGEEAQNEAEAQNES